MTGYDYTADTLAIDPSGWISYIFPPGRRASLPAQAQLGRASRRLPSGSGWYDRNYDLAEEHPAGYATALVQTAIDRYEHRVARQRGTTARPTALMVSGMWPLVASDGARLAHPFQPIGENLLDGGPDITGRHFRAEVLAVEDRAWVSYVFVNPDTASHEQKHTWIVRHDGLLFAAGGTTCPLRRARILSPRPPASASLVPQIGRRQRPAETTKISVTPADQQRRIKEESLPGTAGSARRES